MLSNVDERGSVAKLMLGQIDKTPAQTMAKAGGAGSIPATLTN